MNARLEKFHDSLPHEAFSTCSHHLPPNLADLDFYHNFYHKINHNCGLGAQGKLSERTWHYPRCTGLPCSGGSLSLKTKSKLGGSSSKSLNSLQIIPAKHPNSFTKDLTGNQSQAQGTCIPSQALGTGNQSQAQGHASSHRHRAQATSHRVH